MKLNAIGFFACLLLLLFGRHVTASEGVEAKSIVTIGVADRPEYVYFVAFNPSKNIVRIGPLAYSRVVNDIRIYSKDLAGVKSKTVVHVLPGKAEIANWNLTRHLGPGQFAGMAISKNYFKQTYKESGCKELVFRYRYHYPGGRTIASDPVSKKICW